MDEKKRFNKIEKLMYEYDEGWLSMRTLDSKLRKLYEKDRPKEKK
jgi:hypothetical protein